MFYLASDAEKVLQVRAESFQGGIDPFDRRAR